jgi:hypothetical protein
MGSQYYQVAGDVLVDGVESQRVTSRHWLKVGLALSGGFCIMVFAMVATSASNPTLQSTSAVESTNLVGLSPSFRSPLLGAAKSGIVKRMGQPTVRTSAATFGAGSAGKVQTLSDGVEMRMLSDGARMYNFPDFRSVNPVEKLAVTAIKATTAEVNADQLKNELSNVDDTTKAEVAKLQEAVKRKAKDMAGVTAPMGFFDPLGFSTDVSEGKLLFYREVEVKHGRVAMLASLGFLVAEQFHPLFGGGIDVPSYIAFQETPLQTFWPAVLAAIAIPEIQQIQAFNPPFSSAEEGFAVKDGWSIRSNRVPGDFGFDPLGLKPTNDKEFKEMQTKELNNGRLAMIAAAGMVAQELVTGHKIF